MILDGKKVFKVLEDYEKDLLETHLKQILEPNSHDGLSVITAAQILAVREIGNRLTSPEIKA